MPLQKLTKTWTLPLLLFCIIWVSLSACGHVDVPVDIQDEDLYYLKGESGAVEMHFLSQGSTALSKPEWDAISEGKVAMSLKAFSDFNAEISKLCGQDIPCNYPVIQHFRAVYARLVALRLLEAAPSQQPESSIAHE